MFLHSISSFPKKSHSFSHYARHFPKSRQYLQKSQQQRQRLHVTPPNTGSQYQHTFISHSKIATYHRVASSSADSSIKQQIEETEAKTKFVPRNFQPYPFEYHQEFTLEVLSLTNRGIGICRVDIDPNQQPPPPPQNSTKRSRRGKKNKKNTKDNVDENDINIQQQTKQNGWVVMVPNVIPGEIIKCQIYRNYKAYSDADLLEVIEPSPNRIEKPPCPMFYSCGGCQYQHMDIRTQREWKRQQVQDLLVRIGKLDPSSFPEAKNTAGTDEVYHYRSKITPHYDKPKKIEEEEGSSSDSMEIRAIGFKQKTNRQIIDVPYCYIATEHINEKLNQVRNDKFAEAKEGRLKRPKKGATLLLRDAHKYNDGNDDNEGHNEGHNDDVAVVETDPNVYVQTKVKGLTFRFLAGNFFQNNPYMLPVMVDHVVDAAVKPNSNGDKMTHLIDCYCGSGLFCLSSSSHFDVCVGIEVNEKAVEEATVNAELNKIENCKFVSASAEAIFMSKDTVDIKLPSKSNDENDEKEELTSILVRDFPKSTTTVVVDPPRKGCSTEFLDQLYKFGPERVVYMSCDPATQARDAEGIVGAGYEITSVQPYDLFPQTRHIESLVIFEKKRT